MALSAEILNTGNNAVLTTLITATSLATSSSLLPPSTPTASATVLSAPIHTKSPAASVLDPPTVAGVTIGALIAAVLTFCAVGSIVHWLHLRKARMTRLESEKGEGRWGPNNPELPPPGNSLKEHRPDSVFKKYPKMVENPTAGHRVDASSIGLAVTDDASNRSVSSLAGLLAKPQQVHHNQQHPRMLDHSDTGTHEDRFRSALRPKAPMPPPPAAKRSPPPLDVSLNHSGAPPTVDWPIRPRSRTTIRNASNAHAQRATSNSKVSISISTQTTNTPVKPPQSSRQNPARPKRPQSSLFDYIPDYYLDDSVPTTADLQPPTFSHTATSSMAYANPDSLCIASSPTISAVPSSTLEGPSTVLNRMQDVGLGVPFTIDEAKRYRPTSESTTFRDSNTSTDTTSFELYSSEDTTPEEKLRTLATHCSPIPVSTKKTQAPSPLVGLRYPKVPRSSNERVPRSSYAFPSHALPTPVEDRVTPITPMSATSSIYSRTPASASSAISIHSPNSTGPRQRVGLQRVKTSPAGVSQATFAQTASRKPHISSSYQHSRGPSTGVQRSPAFHYDDSPETIFTTPSTVSHSHKGSGSSSTARTTPSTPWSAGCGVIEVALRSPMWSVPGSAGHAHSHSHSFGMGVGVY